MRKKSNITGIAFGMIVLGLGAIFIWQKNAPLVGTYEEVGQKLAERQAAKLPQAEARKTEATTQVGKEIKTALASKNLPRNEDEKDEATEGSVGIKPLKASDVPMIKRDLPVYGVKPTVNESAPSSQWYRDNANVPGAKKAGG